MTGGTIILHVDDEPAFAELQRTYLEDVFETEFSMETVTDPVAGRAYLDEHDVDCVVCDYDMPEMDGIELLASVREAHPTLPFVLLTARGSEEVASEAMRLGATDYVPKPSGSKEYRALANRIHSVVAQYRRQRRARAEADALRALCDRLPEAVVALDADLQVTVLNERAERLLGRSGAELCGTAVRETALGPEDGPLVETIRQSMSEGEPASVDGYSESLDRDLRVHVYPGPEGVTLSVTDIPE